jgi:hypothetical protein
MEKLIEDKLSALSKILEVDVELTNDKDNENKLRPSYNMPAMISKLYSIFVYAGWPVSAALPPYTGVHADIEFWKKHFAEKAIASGPEPTETAQP